MATRLTAGESEAVQRRVAGALAARGLAAGDRLGLVVSSSGTLLSTVLGALRAGVVPVVLNPALLPAERALLLADADPALVLDDAGGLAALVADGGPEAELAPVPLARPMHYTSGTTGRPKGVWSGVLPLDAATALVAEERDLWGFRATDRNLVCSPLHHSAPIRFGAGTLLAGGEVLILDRFDAAEATDVISEHRPTTAFMVPAHLQRLFERWDATGTPDLSSFRLLAHAGAPCPGPLKERAVADFPPGSVWEFYGSTEGQFTACSTDEWRARPGSVGRARPGRELSVDDDGTIWCRVPEHARFAYWGDPERTAAAWRGDRFSVGDLGRIDADGYLYLDGRREDLIISGGVNVYPMEVEQALEAVPGIGEVVVFGVDDERWGQRVCIVVTGDAPDATVRAAAAERLAPYKRPKDVYRLTDIPRTPTGKVRRTQIPRALGLSVTAPASGSSGG